MFQIKVANGDILYRVPIFGPFLDSRYVWLYYQNQVVLTFNVASQYKIRWKSGRSFGDEAYGRTELSICSLRTNHKNFCCI